MHSMDHDDVAYYDNCKEWCARSSDCGGFTVSGRYCIFDDCQYVSTLYRATALQKNKFSNLLL